MACARAPFRGMRLTSFTDYALRTLMYLAAHREGLVTIRDIAEAHGIAKNHLTKVVHQLGILGVVQTLRGRKGGLKLGLEPSQINLGIVVRSTETDFYMAECFDRRKNACILTPSCALKGVLQSATEAFIRVLDDVTLEQLMSGSSVRADGAGEVMQPVHVYTRARLHPLPAVSE